MRIKQNEFVEVKVYYKDSYNEKDAHIITGKDDMDKLGITESELEYVVVPKKQYEEYLSLAEKVKPLNKSIGEFKNTCLTLIRHPQIVWVEKHDEVFGSYFPFDKKENK
tara:strand:+ start:64 stop:390 length:327 start_codon:yes stop_codon:yes gene_type:complete